MNRCPLTYEPLPEGRKYSSEGLKRLSPRLVSLEDLPLSAEEQRIEARKRAAKISIQGVQFKLSARLQAARGRFEIVDIGGRFILKPQNDLYRQLPENEDLTMRLAATIGIETPLHGLLYSRDGSLTYFIRRFDRAGRGGKIPVEDFAQLAGKTRETKYDFSMEKIVSLIDGFCTFPMIEKNGIFVRTLFNFLVGNEDMHLKNFSLISREGKVELAPAYDFLNTTIALETDAEEIALPLNGKKRNLKREDLVDWFGRGRLSLNEKVVEEGLQRIERAFPAWEDLIERSFLDRVMKGRYLDVVRARRATLSL